MYKIYLLKTDFTQISIFPHIINKINDFMNNNLLAQYQKWQIRLNKYINKNELYLICEFDFKIKQTVQLFV